LKLSATLLEATELAQCSWRQLKPEATLLLANCHLLNCHLALASGKDKANDPALAQRRDHIHGQKPGIESWFIFEFLKASFFEEPINIFFCGQQF
jgi:hypothetical protein